MKSYSIHIYILILLVIINACNSADQASSSADDKDSLTLSNQINDRVDTFELETEEPIPPIEKEKLVWMEMDPVQCLGNAWEKDWLSQPANKDKNYPIGNPALIEPEEKSIIKTFFSKQNIYIAEIQSESYPDNAVICDACECPAGYTLYIKLPESKSQALSAFGFNLSASK